jgi:DNA (cytosine-5)-methyltransferase 3A
MKKIKVLSLFDGISCAQEALKKLGYDPEYYASEVDKYTIEVTQNQHPETKQLGSVEDINGTDFAGVDLIIGGSPCQDLSVAKVNREGLAGKRSKLFFDFVRILKEAKPKYFVLENVASMNRESKEKITEILGVEPIMIDAALVSAQSRKRLF